MPVVAVCSGKGGVGKTTIAVNLAVILSQIGKRVILVDADTAMANVGIVLGIDRAPLSLHNVLTGDTSVTDALYEGPAKLRYVPSGLSLEGAGKLDFSRFAPAINELAKMAEYVIIDCPPGLEPSNQQVLRSAKEVLIVVTPDPSSLADGLKLRQFASRSGIRIVGIIVNRVNGEPDEVKISEIETLMGNKVVGVIPEDAEIRRANYRQLPIMMKNQGAPGAVALRKLASAYSGEKIAEPAAPKKGFLAGFFDSLFGKKK